MTLKGDEEASSGCKSPPPDLRVLRLTFEVHPVLGSSAGRVGGPQQVTRPARAVAEGQHMRTLFISAILISTLATGGAIESAQAKGCIKGALVGGLAGHAAGHGVLGAVGGCVAGRAVAKRAARQRAQRIQAQGQRNLGNSGTVQPPGYNPGIT